VTALVCVCLRARARASVRVMHTARHALGHTRHDDTTEKTASVQSERRPERAGASMPPRTRAFAVGPGPAAASMSPVLYSRATLPSSLRRGDRDKI
jgi:hypothetical protein